MDDNFAGTGHKGIYFMNSLSLLKHPSTSVYTQDTSSKDAFLNAL